MPMHLDRLIEAGEVGLVRSAPLVGMVTDSAAAATAMATGVRTTNEAIGLGPDGQDPVSVLEQARALGMATGVVTTTRVTHATAAAFLAEWAARWAEGAEEELAARIAGAPPDVLLGGGAREWVPEGRRLGDVLSLGLLAGRDRMGVRRDGRDLVGEVRERGYRVVADAEELAAAAGRPRLLGLVAASHLPYALDRRALPGGDRVPGLPELVAAALASLSAGPNGFILVVEGGRIDHAGHDNDVAAEVAEVEEFDAALGVAYEFAGERDDTLLLVTADHDTGGRGFSYRHELDAAGRIVGINYVGAANLEAIRRQEVSFRTMRREWLERSGSSGSGPSPEAVRAVVRERAGVSLADEEVRRLLDPEPLSPWHVVRPPYRPESYPSHILGQLLGPVYGTVWATGNHTNVPVMLVGFGPGAERVRGLHHNDRVHTVMVEALGWLAAEAEREGSAGK